MINIQYCIEEENSPNVFYHLSILSGPFLASLAGSILCLIPVPNVLEQPKYAFLEVTLRNLSGGLLHFGQMMIRTVYWSKFTFEKRMKTYFLMLGLEIFMLFSIFMIYYYVWIIHFAFAYPLPLGHLVAGSITAIVIAIAAAFR